MFGSTEMFRLRQSLVRLTQEVKHLKRCDRENEESIKTLVNQKHSLEKAKDELEQNLQQTKKELENASNDLVQQYEEKIRRIETEHKPSDVSTEMNKAVRSKLKAELATLQMTNYQQEKTITELEAKLKTAQGTSENALHQWSSLDTRLTALSKLYQTGADSLTRLEEAVKCAHQVNRSLSYKSRHHECQMKAKTEEVAKLQEQVAKLRTDLAAKPEKEFSLQALESQVDNLKKKIQQLEEEKDDMKKELDIQLDKNVQSSVKCQQAHDLINQHLDNARKHHEETQRLTKALQEKTDHCDVITGQLATLQTQVTEDRNEFEEATGKWKIKKLSLEEEVEAKRSEIKSLSEEKTSLGEEKDSLCKQYEELMELWADAKSKLDVKKEDSILQTGSSIFSQTDQGLQIQPDTRTVECQGSNPDLTDNCQQTESPGRSDAQIQTDSGGVTTVDVDSQTVPVVSVSRGTQPGDDPLSVPKYTQTVHTPKSGLFRNTGIIRSSVLHATLMDTDKQRLDHIHHSSLCDNGTNSYERNPECDKNQTSLPQRFNDKKPVSSVQPSSRFQTPKKKIGTVISSYQNHDIWNESYRSKGTDDSDDGRLIYHDQDMNHPERRSRDVQLNMKNITKDQKNIPEGNHRDQNQYVTLSEEKYRNELFCQKNVSNVNGTTGIYERHANTSTGFRDTDTRMVQPNIAAYLQKDNNHTTLQEWTDDDRSSATLASKRKNDGLMDGQNERRSKNFKHQISGLSNETNGKQVNPEQLDNVNNGHIKTESVDDSIIYPMQDSVATTKMSNNSDTEMVSLNQRPPEEEEDLFDSSPQDMNTVTTKQEIPSPDVAITESDVTEPSELSGQFSENRQNGPRYPHLAMIKTNWDSNQDSYTQPNEELSTFQRSRVLPRGRLGLLGKPSVPQTYVTSSNTFSSGLGPVLTTGHSSMPDTLVNRAGALAQSDCADSPGQVHYANLQSSTSLNVPHTSPSSIGPLTSKLLQQRHLGTVSSARQLSSVQPPQPLSSVVHSPLTSAKQAPLSFMAPEQRPPLASSYEASQPLLGGRSSRKPRKKASRQSSSSIYNHNGRSLFPPNISSSSLSSSSSSSTSYAAREKNFYKVALSFVRRRQEQDKEEVDVKDEDKEEKELETLPGRDAGRESEEGNSCGGDRGQDDGAVTIPKGILKEITSEKGKKRAKSKSVTFPEELEIHMFGLTPNSQSDCCSELFTTNHHQPSTLADLISNHHQLCFTSEAAPKIDQPLMTHSTDHVKDDDTMVVDTEDEHLVGRGEEKRRTDGETDEIKEGDLSSKNDRDNGMDVVPDSRNDRDLTALSPDTIPSSQAFCSAPPSTCQSAHNRLQ